MPYAEINEPIPGPTAFHETGDAAAMSQAAVLLLLGAQLRGDDYALHGRAAAVGLESAMDAMPEEDLQRFPVPRLTTAGARVAFERARFGLAERYGAAVAAPMVPAVERPLAPFPQDAAGDLADRLYQQPDPLIAAQLMELHLRHTDELLRVAAAAAYRDLCAEPARLVPVLVAGTTSEDPLIRELAATALAHVEPAHQRLAALTEGAGPGPGGAPAHTSLLIHGTFARGSAWWQPGGDFHSYVLNNVRPDLYAAADRFDWSGGYSNQARADGADTLRDWLQAHNLIRAELIAHSHGGSVAMLATQQEGVLLSELVLLSCPVHVHRYMPEFASVWKVVSIRVKMDLVILLDGGGQRFRHPQIQENVLPIWFDHSATHEPDVWRDHDVPSML